MKANEKEQIYNYLINHVAFCIKEVLTVEEASKYMGIKKSYLYKLTMNKQIPHYKPMGKMCYFNRLELERWLQKNNIKTDEEIEQEAQKNCRERRGK